MKHLYLNFRTWEQIAVDMGYNVRHLYRMKERTPEQLKGQISYCSANELNMIHQRQAEGIAAAKARGVKMGRPPKPLPDNFYEIYQRWKSGSITAVEAASLCDMPISTFKYKAKSYQQGTQSEEQDDI